MCSINKAIISIVIIIKKKCSHCALDIKLLHLDRATQFRLKSQTSFLLVQRKTTCLQLVIRVPHSRVRIGGIKSVLTQPLLSELWIINCPSLLTMSSSISYPQVPPLCINCRLGTSFFKDKNVIISSVIQIYHENIYIN